MDKAELHAHRQTLRKPNTQDARDKLQQAHGKQYSLFTMMEAQQDVDHLLWEDEGKLEPPMQKRPVRHQPEPQKRQPKRDNEESYRDYYDEVEVCEAAAWCHYKNAHRTRNRAMVDRSDLVVFCIQRGSGGAWQTMKYVKNRVRPISIFTIRGRKRNIKTERHSEKNCELHKRSIYFLMRICYHNLIYA